MYTMVVVTDKANHNMHYKDRPAAVAALRQMNKARIAWAAVERDLRTERGVALSLAQFQDAMKARFYFIEDDYEVTADIDLDRLVTTQISSMKHEKDVEEELAILNLHGDIKRGERINDDPQLREAQRKATAKQSLALPVGRG